MFNTHPNATEKCSAAHPCICRTPLPLPPSARRDQALAELANLLGTALLPHGGLSPELNATLKQLARAPCAASTLKQRLTCSAAGGAPANAVMVSFSSIHTFDQRQLADAQGAGHRVCFCIDHNATAAHNATTTAAHNATSSGSGAPSSGGSSGGTSGGSNDPCASVCGSGCTSPADYAQKPECAACMACQQAQGGGLPSGAPSSGFPSSGDTSGGGFPSSGDTSGGGALSSSDTSGSGAPSNATNHMNATAASSMHNATTATNHMNVTAASSSTKSSYGGGGSSA
jgi:hypothetical protein